MATSKLNKGLDEQLLEGGGAGASMQAAKQGQSVAGQAVKNARKNQTSDVEEMIKLDRMLDMRRELQAAKAKPERQAAERNATTREEGGAKVTSYPYAGPNEYKKGGKVASASKRADGIAQKGKTKGRMI
jgi:hypothetical protein